MEFSKKLKELRNRKGISQTKLAEEIHISRSAVAKWENGLGLPGEESLRILSEYFDVNIKELIPDKENEESNISKNKTIKNQQNIITILIVIISFVLIYFIISDIEKFKDQLGLFGLGIIITVLGVFNLKGNISSIHWYNRRKVTKENQNKYCIAMGSGTLIIGLSFVVSSFIQAFISIETGAFIIVGGVLIGLALMLYAQIKYNRGIF